MPYYTNFFWATFFILYDPLEFSTGACPTPSGLEMAKTHHCVLLGHQIGSTSNIVLGEEGVRNSEKLYHLWTPSRHGLATLFCCHYFIVDVTIKGNNVMILISQE